MIVKHNSPGVTEIRVREVEEWVVMLGFERPEFVKFISEVSSL